MQIKEQILRAFMGNKNKKLVKSKIQEIIGLEKKNKHVFDVVLKELIGEGIVTSSKIKRLSLNNNIKFFIGKFQFNPKGYGFCISTENNINSTKIKGVFIPPNSIKNAMNNDRVVVKINKDTSIDRKAEGEIISILSRGVENLVGTYINNGTFGFVVPDNSKISKDIYIEKNKSLGAESYCKVVVKITKYPNLNRKAEGEIIEVIGSKEDHEIKLLSVIAENEIRTEFPYKVIKQVERIDEKIPEEELKRRRDLTDLNTFTIDGSDAKDLDDAISIRRLSNGNYELGVHIADVSHYVKEKSAIDREALERGTSVYLINTVIPMLPKKLSNNLCSLNPNTIKLTLSVFMEIDKNGQVVRNEINESYISSKARLTYEEVSDYLEGKNDNLIEKYPFISGDIKEMEKLKNILSNKRRKRGTIEFNFNEAKIVLDENDNPVEIDKYDRRIANDIIEELMLVANETVAEKFFDLQIPFVYRVHEKPREEKIDDFLRFIRLYGYGLELDLESINTNNLNELIKSAEGKPESQAINLLLLQSMQQARYNPVPKGHFGLGCKFYSHFTSPIRRYPDLQIHRIIKEYLNGLITPERKTELVKIVDMSSKKSSKKERQAQNAEIEYDNIKKAEYMSKQIGNEYIGMITGMTNAGLYITLDNTVEGFMRIDRIKGEEFILNKEEHVYTGMSSGRRIIPGGKIRVSVYKVNVDSKDILFDFIDYM